MKKEICGVQTYYEEYGQGCHVILLLHGWGMDKRWMEWIAKYFQEDFHVYLFDLPGFGESELLESWDINDYVEWLATFCKEEVIENPIIIAHSFGCRIALWYSYQFACQKMVLTGAAGIQSHKNRIQKWQELEYHIIKYIYMKLGLRKQMIRLQNNRGSMDYRLANSVMKNTLVKVLQSDVSSILQGIATPTLVIMGEKDMQTPLWMGKKMVALLQDAALIVFEKGDHFAFLQQKKRFLKIVEVFLEGR